MIEPVELACPRCDKTPLDAGETGPFCAGCKIEFPLIGGIPWLFSEPGAALDEWRNRHGFLLQTLAHREAGYRKALDRPDATALTRRRLELLAAATARLSEQLGGLLEPLRVAELTADRDTYLALRTKLPPDQGLMTYYGNVHRDWAWGDAENAASLAIVRDRLDGRDPGRTLVLGCGAGRLAHDIAIELGPARTVALDFNPLLVFVADRMSRGESLELVEFPVAPLDLEHAAVSRELRAPAAAAVTYCLADVHRPPFPPRSFDTIVTPWLVDVVPEPLSEMARRINRLLADGGCWINFGSLSFHDVAPELALSLEECLETIAAQGFDLPAAHDTEIPYLASPASRHGRRETVASWAATKTRHIARAERFVALPDWIVRAKDPVPMLEHFRSQAVATRIHAYILSLIDGKRSIADIAVLLEAQRLMPRAEAEASVRQFMIRLYEDSTRGTRY